MGRKLAAVSLFRRGKLGSHLTQYGLGRDIPSYQVAPRSIQPFDHNRHGPKSVWGWCLFLGERSSHLTQCRLGRGPRPTSVPSGILIQPAISPQQTWAVNGGCVPLGGAGSPSNTMWPGPRPISVPSFILHDTSNRLATIHHRHRQTDRSTVDSIGRAVLQTVAQQLMRITSTVLVNSQHLPANILIAVLESKLMSFTYTVVAEYWGAHILHEPRGPNIVGLEPLGPHEVGVYLFIYLFIYLL